MTKMLFVFISLIGIILSVEGADLETPPESDLEVDSTTKQTVQPNIQDRSPVKEGPDSDSLESKLSTGSPKLDSFRQLKEKTLELAATCRSLAVDFTNLDTQFNTQLRMAALNLSKEKMEALEESVAFCFKQNLTIKNEKEKLKEENEDLKREVILRMAAPVEMLRLQEKVAELKKINEIMQHHCSEVEAKITTLEKQLQTYEWENRERGLREEFKLEIEKLLRADRARENKQVSDYLGHMLYMLNMKRDVRQLREFSTFESFQDMTEHSRILITDPLQELLARCQKLEKKNKRLEKEIKRTKEDKEPNAASNTSDSEASEALSDGSKEKECLDKIEDVECLEKEIKRTKEDKEPNAASNTSDSEASEALLDKVEYHASNSCCTYKNILLASAAAVGSIYILYNII
jgi:hypothetical protein